LAILAFFGGLIVLLTIVPAVWIELVFRIARSVRIEKRAAEFKNSSAVDVPRFEGYTRVYLKSRAGDNLAYDESVSQAYRETRFLKFIGDVSRILLSWNATTLKNAVFGWLGLAGVKSQSSDRAIGGSNDDLLKIIKQYFYVRSIKSNCGKAWRPAYARRNWKGLYPLRNGD
jgi:hypothetical protein